VEGNWSNRLTHFGILLGRDRVVIIIEPQEASQNISRTHLKKPDGSEFAWLLWQNEFRTKLPAEIQAYLESLLNQRNKASSSKAIQKRLMSLHSLYTLSGFEPLVVQPPIENLKVDEPTPLEALQDDRAIDLITPPDGSEPAPPETLEKLKVEPAKYAAQSEDEKESQENYFPRVEWTTEAQSPQLAGRAAEFVEYSNIILANQDFKGLQDIFKYFTEQYDLSDERTKVVRNAILENAEQALMESVAGVLSLKSEPNWGGSYHQALTKEALSAVLMQRFWSVKAVEDQLNEILKGQGR